MTNSQNRMEEFRDLIEREWAGQLDDAGRARLDELCAQDPDLADELREERRLSALLARHGPNHAPGDLKASILNRLDEASAGQSRSDWRELLSAPVLRWGMGLAVVALIAFEVNLFLNQNNQVNEVFEHTESTSRDLALITTPEPTAEPAMQAEPERQEAPPATTEIDGLSPRERRRAGAEIEPTRTPAAGEELLDPSRETEDESTVEEGAVELARVQRRRPTAVNGITQPETLTPTATPVEPAATVQPTASPTAEPELVDSLDLVDSLNIADTLEMNPELAPSTQTAPPTPEASPVPTTTPLPAAATPTDLELASIETQPDDTGEPPPAEPIDGAGRSPAGYRTGVVVQSALPEQESILERPVESLPTAPPDAQRRMAMTVQLSSLPAVEKTTRKEPQLVYPDSIDMQDWRFGIRSDDRSRRTESKTETMPQPTVRDVEIAVAMTDGTILTPAEKIEGRPGHWRIQASMTPDQLEKFFRLLEEMKIGSAPASIPRRDGQASTLSQQTRGEAPEQPQRRPAQFYEVTSGEWLLRELKAPAQTPAVHQPIEVFIWVNETK